MVVNYNIMSGDINISRQIRIKLQGSTMFYLFAFGQYESQGGWHDFRGKYKYLIDAIEAADSFYEDWHIVWNEEVFLSYIDIINAKQKPSIVWEEGDHKQMLMPNHWPDSKCINYIGAGWDWADIYMLKRRFRSENPGKDYCTFVRI